MLTVILFILGSMVLGLVFAIILLSVLALCLTDPYTPDDELKQGYRSSPPASNGGRRR